MEKEHESDNISGMITQHKELDSQLKALRNALKEDCTSDALVRGLNELVRFTEAHFADEERLMRLYGFDGLESHCRTHQLLSDRIARLREDILENCGEEEKNRLLAFLEGDFQYHVIEDTQAWERGEIARKFAYQRLGQHEAEGRSGNLPYEIN